MRVGYNPHKDFPNGIAIHTHQVIIPVYIPDFSGYFKDGLTILKLCLASLEKTTHSKTFITVVNNGSCDEVIAFLNGLLSEKKIHEIVHTENIGKPNAILKGLSGHDIEIVTICDADTMFLPGWQQETAKIFSRIPKAGVVGLVPQMKTFRTYSGNTMFDNLFNDKLRFMPLKNEDGFTKFYDSIGWFAETYNENHRKYILALNWDNDLKAILGAGHFVLTYKKDIFDEVRTYLGHKLGGDSEAYLDGIALQKDYWRLTTFDNYAYHLGNLSESWMQQELDNMTPIHSETPSGFARRKRVGYMVYFFKNRAFVKFIKTKWVYRRFLRWKKLPADMIGKY
ncbi:MAG: glycosyltransferase family 2 protein [Flavobacterium sp.]|nr:MAG: glycosyltransferase family 2 protein [Flavobacterium sp.]